MVLGQKDVSEGSGPLPKPVLKWVALYLPLRWPAGIETVPEIDQQIGGTSPADFMADVAELESLLTVIATRGSAAPWPTHPFFGRMSHADWLRWGYLHLDHHLRQFGL
jgi:hypothetical protein